MDNPSIPQLFADRAALAFAHGPTYTGGHHADYVALQARLAEALASCATPGYAFGAAATGGGGIALPTSPVVRVPATAGQVTINDTVCAGCHRADRRLAQGTTYCVVCLAGQAAGLARKK